MAPIEGGAPIELCGGIPPIGFDGCGTPPSGPEGKPLIEMGGIPPIELGGIPPIELGGIPPIELGGPPIELGGIPPIELGGIPPIELGGIVAGGMPGLEGCEV